MWEIEWRRIWVTEDICKVVSDFPGSGLGFLGNTEYYFWEQNELIWEDPARHVLCPLGGDLQYQLQSQGPSPGVPSQPVPECGTYLGRAGLGSPRMHRSLGWRCRSECCALPTHSQRGSCTGFCPLCWILSHGGLLSIFPQDFHMCGSVRLLGKERKK